MALQIKVSNGNELIPLTKPILDYKRAELAYNLLYGLSSPDICFTVHETDFHLEKENILAMDENGDIVQMGLDPEWHGTKQDNDDVKQQCLEADKKFAETEGWDWNEELESELQERYTVAGFTDDGVTAWAGPLTWDYGKANDMLNLMKYGMDESVTITAPLGEFSFDGMKLVSEDWDVMEQEDHPDWAKENPLGDALSELESEAKPMEL